MVGGQVQVLMRYLPQMLHRRCCRWGLTHPGKQAEPEVKAWAAGAEPFETREERHSRIFFYWERNMGVKNYLIEGVSCTGKTSVCDELQLRGYHAIHGDRELAYWGDLKTGDPVDGNADEHRAWIWDVEKVRALVADQNYAATFFCGGCRNSDRFIDLFDGVIVLEVDLDTLNRRLAARPEDEWGGTASEGESFARLQHETKESLPENALIIDATAPLLSVVDTILENANQVSP
jgi:broad-specificity NMP kinase